jgi:hypothetical protein
MANRYWWAAAAGLVAVAGCAGKQKADERQASPAARQIEASQARSQQALEDAAGAQRRASEQSRKAQEARRAAQAAELEARAAQQRAVQAAQRWRDEQARAVQAQELANRATQDAARVAQQAQAQASQVLADQGPQAGERTAAGQVTEASGDRITITPGDGVPLSFELTPRTQVEVDGRQASAGEIQQGDDARVAYDPSSRAAVKVVVRSGGR